jgi:hypothetical protein
LCCSVRQVKGVDEFSDLAVVQVALQRGDTLPGTPLGDSDEMQVCSPRRRYTLSSSRGRIECNVPWLRRIILRK